MKNYIDKDWLIQKAVKSKSGRYYWKTVTYLTSKGLYRNLQLVDMGVTTAWFVVAAFYNTKEIHENVAEDILKKLNFNYYREKKIREIIE